MLKSGRLFAIFFFFVANFGTIIPLQSMQRSSFVVDASSAPSTDNYRGVEALPVSFSQPEFLGNLNIKPGNGASTSLRSSTCTYVNALGRTNVYKVGAMVKVPASFQCRRCSSKVMYVTCLSPWSIGVFFFSLVFWLLVHVMSVI